MSTIRSVGFRIDSTHSVSTRVHSGLHCRWWCLRLVSVIADVASGWVRAGLQLDDGASASECPLLPRDRLRDLSAVGGHLGGLSYQSGPSGALIQGDTGLLWRAWGVYWLGYEGGQQRLRVAFPSFDPGRNQHDCPHQTDAHSDQSGEERETTRKKLREWMVSAPARREPSFVIALTVGCDWTQMAHLSQASNVAEEKCIFYDVTGFTQQWRSIPVATNCMCQRVS